MLTNGSAAWGHVTRCSPVIGCSLHPVNVLMCPHTCVTNLPKPREVHSDVGPASVIVGNLVQVEREIRDEVKYYCYSRGLHFHSSIYALIVR